MLHQSREQTPHCALTAIEAHRAQLMNRIDSWVLLVSPQPLPTARVHTHTMGQVIDRLAQLTAHTYTALAAGPDEVFWEATEFVDDLAIAYTDLATELLAGTRRLPVTTTSL
ncbi:DUF4254 domain-containing protein [Nocardia aurea]|uniref:DUF4254 domain-containing protein n=1 Tax=Nocardia aurea TaxID=2144174 RepID=A0ABV3G511_9NOCA